MGGDERRRPDTRATRLGASWCGRAGAGTGVFFGDTANSAAGAGTGVFLGDAASSAAGSVAR